MENSVCLSSNDLLKERKDSLETRVVLLIFLLELELSGVAVQSIYQNSKKWQLLATFWYYDHGAKASEEVPKIATDQKECHKCSLCVITC